MTVLAPRPLVFVHIPKAAGSTLQELIAARYEGGRSFIFTGDPAQRREFAELPEEERGAFDVLMGHVQFGIDRLLPDPATYITVLRDPVERVVSHYHFILARPEHYLHESLRRRGYSLRDWLLEARPLVVDNYQIRWLIGTPLGEIPPGGVTRAMLEEAKWNLENAFSIVGLVERFGETLACLGRAFGWPLLDGSVQRNANPERPTVDQLDAPTIAAIRERNALEIELYRFVRALFEEQCRRLRIDVHDATPPEVAAAREALAGLGDDA